jgi:hypothetical protein
VSGSLAFGGQGRVRDVLGDVDGSFGFLAFGGVERFLLTTLVRRTAQLTPDGCHLARTIP